MSAQPVVTTTVVDSVPPRIEVTVVPSDAADTLTIWRMLPDASRTVLRGADRVPVTGTVFVVDTEAPFGVPVSYVAVGYTVAGVASPDSVASVAVTIDATEAWLSDPREPASVTSVLIESWQVRQHPVSTSRIDVLGRRRPIVLWEPAKSAVSSIGLVTLTANDRDVMRSMLGVRQPLLLRGPASWDVGQLYFALTSLSEERIGLAMAVERRWAIDVIEVDQPSPQFFGSLRFWSDVLEAATWADVLADNATWLDVLRGPAV